MQREIAAVQAGTNLRDFAQSAAAQRRAVFAVYDGARAVGTIAAWQLAQIPPEQWPATTVGQIADHHVPRVPPDYQVTDALQLLSREKSAQLLFVGTEDGGLEGVVTKTDIVRALQTRGIARVRDRVA